MLKTNIKKIAVIGPESTGKSTICEALAAELQTVWVKEYAREYLELLPYEYTQADLLAIAKGQMKEEDTLLPTANNYLICDTELNVIKVWSEHKYGSCDTQILDEIAVRRYDLYLLTDVDMPWQFDPLREHAEDHMRRYFFNVYKDIVLNSETPWVQISGGSAPARLQLALQAVMRLL